MVLLHKMVQVLGLPQFDDAAAMGKQTTDCCDVGTALVDGDLRGRIVLANRALEEPTRGRCVTARGQQEVNRLA